MLTGLGRKAGMVFLAGTMTYASGCSLFQPEQEPISITAWQPGAMVSVNNRPVGASPLIVDLDRDHTYAVAATANGQTGTAVIGRSVSITGILDIVGGCFFLAPFIGCFTPGFWELQPKQVYVPPPPPPPAQYQPVYPPPR